MFNQALAHGWWLSLVAILSGWTPLAVLGIIVFVAISAYVILTTADC